MKPNTCFKTVIILLLIFFALPGKAQHADSATYIPGKIYYWGGGHVGPGNYLFNAGLDAGVLLGDLIVVGAKADISQNLRVFGPPIEQVEARESALLLGVKLTHHPYSNWILLSGISAVSFKDRGAVTSNTPGYFGGNNYADDVYYHGTGVPAIVKYTMAPANIFAMDLAAAVNINPHRTFFTLTFGIAFGRVRSGATKARLDGGSRAERLRRPQKNLDIKT